MRYTSFVATALAVVLTPVGVLASPDSEKATNLLDDLTQQAREILESAPAGKANTCGCKPGDAAIRKDWNALTDDERKAYISAVKCLQSKPSLYAGDFAPGAQSRYDDFVAVHINQTLTIHGTGNFLTWHRYFTWAYENALREECGYKGYQPYWNWFDQPEDPYSTKLFDGSETSMSGDGEYLEHNGTLASLGNLWIPSGKGGGCIKSGPFKDYTVSLGPVRAAMDGMEPNPNGPMGSNVRCLRRDLSTFALTRFMTYDNVYRILRGSESSSIAEFQTELQGRFDVGFLGLHTTGHSGLGGDASDLFSSPNDPSFFLHHAMVDRVYWIWQALHARQANTIAGTITVNNSPPSRDALVTDMVHMGNLASARPIKDLLSTLNGPFCYMYL